MQEVYRALDLSLRRRVALKIPKNDSAKKRFQRSAAMSARVTHPNVAKTFDYVIDHGRQVLIEEFVKGEDLRSRLTSHFQYLDPHLAAHVFHHLVKGIAAVHRVEVIHRDLKPSNIMVSCDADIATVKITDFGIAKMAEVEIAEGMKDSESTLASATVVGALPFMAPEVIRNSKDVSLSADIWSAGAILYHLLTGGTPFGDGLAAVQKILKAERPARPPLLMQGGQFAQLSDELWSIIEKCLNASPDKRPTAAELVKAFGKICYSRVPRCLGTIRSYRAFGGNWGFVRCDGDDDAFFHGASVWGSQPAAGLKVSLAQFPGDPLPRAHPVLPLRSEDN